MKGNAQQGARQILKEMFGVTSEPGSQEAVRRPWLTGFLLPFGSVLIAALAFLTQDIQLPKWAISLAVLYLVVVSGTALYIPAAWFVSWSLSKRRLARLAKTTLPKLGDAARQFQQLVAQGHSNTLLYVLQEASAWDEVRSNQPPLFDQEHVETMRSWLTLLSRRIGRSKPSEFASLCGELGELVHQYNRFCCLRHRMLQGIVAVGRLPDQRLRCLKQEWNVNREGHATFVRAWAELSHRINTVAGIQLCPDYYEPVGTLE